MTTKLELIASLKTSILQSVDYSSAIKIIELSDDDIPTDIQAIIAIIKIRDFCREHGVRAKQLSQLLAPDIEISNATIERFSDCSNSMLKHLASRYVVKKI